MKTKLLPLLLLAFATTAFAEDKPEFIDNKDGTITHTPSGLVWQKCSVGQTWDSSFGTCVGDAKTYTYDDAKKIKSDFSGQKDWRVPNIKELSSLVDFAKINPSIKKPFSPKMPFPWFLSVTLDASNPDSVWVVHFGYGYEVSMDKKFINDAVRLVRGGQLPSSFSLDTPTIDFVNNKDGTVTHTKTGLTWQRCVIGTTLVDDYCDGIATNFIHGDALALTSDVGGKTDWRLPTLYELETLVDYVTQNATINPLAFPDTLKSEFWTASDYAGDNNNAWVVNFRNGGRDLGIKNNSKYTARLVRGTMSFNGATTSSSTSEKSGSVDLVSTLTANPSPAKMGGDLTYTATITNKGTTTATGAKVTFFVAPKFMTFKNSSANCDYSGGLSAVCQIGDLAAGANVTKTMTVTLKKAGGISSSVSAKANEKDANPADNIGKTSTGVKK